MPVAKLLGTSTPDAMKSDEGTDSLDTFIRQAVGKEPLFSFSRTGDSPTQWIQLLHTFDQPDLPGWPLLAPMKVQLQKCDKCSREFCSTINYRRHIRVHRRSMNFHKEPQKYRDLLGAFWDKLNDDEAKDIMSFKDVTLEEVPGSSIVKNIAANLRKPIFLSLPQVYVKAGSALVDIIQGRSSMLRVSSQELFSVLDDASERTFLCAGTAESLKKYVFDGEAGKIGLEMKNLIACTSFLVEQKLVKAWLADKDAEALKCQKLLVEEEEAAQRRQAELLERKRQRKIRQKEQRARDQSNDMKVELSTASDLFESIPSAENSGRQISPEIDSLIPDGNGNVASPFDLIQLSSNEEALDHLDSAANKLNNSSQHFIARWQVPKSQRNGRNGRHNNNNQNGNYVKWEPAHKHREQRGNNGGKIWTKKPKPESGVTVKSRVDSDANNQTAQNGCQLMIGSISVTVRNSTTNQPHVNSSVAEFKDNDKTENKTKSGQNVANRGQSTDISKSQMLEEDVTSTRGVDQNLTRESCQQSLEVNGSASEDTNVSDVQVEGGDKLTHFSVDAAKDFLSQRWKEAVAGDHVELVLTTAPEPSVQLDHAESGPSKGQADSSVHANAKPKFRNKSMKTKYIPKQRPVY
ncbi:putative transcription factor C2H2 family [Helianthus annuus]|nr:putative transcription factor C2H2 family [Helianthus annuus]KAJ0842557.1 putative transcription factor C2H2 family [Helianthus annuus]KAJ0856207.1 putative transcription factor C2H2 family [Helianthus annuus]